MVMQFRTMMRTTANSEMQNAKVLAMELENELNRSIAMKSTLTGLEAERERLIEGIGLRQDNQGISDLLRERNHALFVAGLTDVQGSGIIMTLNDAAVVGDLDIEDYIIHDSDIVPLLNELRAAGAQAISINGERILATTKTVCAGPTILINGSRHPVPYEVKAIGDPYTLFSTLEASESVVLMRLYNIRVDIEMFDNIVINRYRILDNLDELMSGLEVVKP